MRKELKLAGFGGQGIISMAVMVALATGKFDKNYVAQTQSYGPEARGGACKAEVVISDEPIDYIKTISPGVFIAMSQPALDKYIDTVDPETATLIIDNTFVENIPAECKNVFSIPATDIAEEKIGMRVTANIVMFGYAAKIAGFATKEACINAMKEYLPAKVIDVNLKAFEEGYNYGE